MAPSCSFFDSAAKNLSLSSQSNTESAPRSPPTASHTPAGSLAIAEPISLRGRRCSSLPSLRATITSSLPHTAARRSLLASASAVGAGSNLGPIGLAVLASRPAL